MSDVFRQQVSDQSTDDVRPQRRQIIVSGLPLKSWRSWQWGHTAYVVTTSIPLPPRVGRRTPVRTTTLQCVGASGRTRTSRSEEHTSELQSQSNLVCRLLLEK